MNAGTLSLGPATLCQRQLMSHSLVCQALAVTPSAGGAGYIVPEWRPVWVLLPNSWGLLLWDSMIRWLAVAFFIQIPIDIAYNMQERLLHWYYITIQVSCMLSCCPPRSQLQSSEPDPATTLHALVFAAAMLEVVNLASFKWYCANAPQTDMNIRHRINTPHGLASCRVGGAALEVKPSMLRWETA